MICCDRAEIYVADRDDGVFLAEAVYGVPLLWLCLFRPTNLVTGALEQVGVPCTATAPVGPKNECIANLEITIPRLQKALTLKGDWEPYGHCLAASIDAAQGKFVTVYLDEIAALSGERFYTELLRALLHLNGKEVAGGHQALLSMAEIHGKRELFDPRGFYTLENLQREDYRNFDSILGEP